LTEPPLSSSPAKLGQDLADAFGDKDVFILQ